MGQSSSKEYSLVSDTDHNFVLERMDEDESSEDELYTVSDKETLAPSAEDGGGQERWY